MISLAHRSRRTSLAPMLAGAALALVFAAAPSHAAISSAVEGRAVVTATIAAPLSIGVGMVGAGDNAVILLGEPGRVYQISVSAGSAVALSSQNSGDITTIGQSSFNAAGRDTVRIGEAGALPHNAVVSIVYD